MIKKRNVVFLALLFAISILFATEENIKFESGYPLNQDLVTKGINASSRYVKNTLDFYTKATFILLQPKEQGLDAALISSINNPTNKPASNLNTHFDYDPGFKFLLGLTLGEDNWDLWMEYTRFYSKDFASRKIDINSQNLDNYWRLGTTIDDQNFIRSKWYLGWNNFDFALGRVYFFGTKLTLHPFVGIRSGWLDQKIKVKYANLTDSYETNLHSDSWLVGTRIGIESNWLLVSNCRFFGTLAGSLFYQHFNLSAKELDKNDPTNFTTNAYSRHQDVNGALELNVGFGWGTYFAANKYHFDGIVGYELDVLWNQNTLRSFAEEIKDGNDVKAGNFSPHGFNISMRFDF